jgi:hypothetical protein
VNKNYVDGNLAGLTWKNSVKAATNGNITLSGAQTVDGVALVAGNRVLVKNQTTASANGIYVVAAGAWTRSTDMDATTPINEVNSAAVFVEGGTTFADTGWTQVNNVSTLETDAIAFTQFNGASGITAGVGLVKSGNTLDVNLGAGIAQLPTDEVGVDVYATGGLMTTVDGTTSSTLTNAQLSLVKVGTAGTYKSVTTDDFGRVTAGSNPTTLAGYGITDAQALDADLTAIAALAGTSGFLKKTAVDTWTLDTTTYATDSLAMHLAGAETATGLKTFSAGIKLPDASNFYLGTDNDLGLTHSGAHATITNSTGNLTVNGAQAIYLNCYSGAGSNIELLNGSLFIDSAATSIRTQGGTTIAYFNAAGCDITGSLGTSTNMNCQGTVTCSSFYTRQYIPLIASLGGQANNAYDRGWKFKWHNGTNEKEGFFGYDKSTGKFTFVPEVTSSVGDIVVGTKGTIDAYLAWADVTGRATTLAGYGITDAAPLSHTTDETIHLTSAQNTWIDAITATSAEVNYLSGVTSAIQTQLNNKQALDADLTAIAALAGTSGYLKKTAADTWTLDTATLATDSNVVHLAGTETITGFKTFSTAPLISAADASTRLIVQNTSSTVAQWPGIAILNYNSGFAGGFPAIELQSARGSSAAPAVVQSGDILGSVAGWGWNGSGSDDVARIHFVAGSTFDGVTDNGNIEFLTQLGTTLTKRMAVEASGSTSFYPSSITSNFYMGASGANPIVVFDSTDYIAYDRTANSYNFYIGGTSELSLSSASAIFGGHVKVEDNNAIYVGTGNDLYMVHDGTNSAIVNQTGILNITNTAVGGALVLRSENNGGSNFELWGGAAYLDASTTYIRSQDGGTVFATFNSGGLTLGTAANIGKVGTINVTNTTNIGASVGNNVAIVIQNASADGNTVKDISYLVRKSVGAGWDNVKLHQGVAIDVSFGTPGTDSKTWWERDPSLGTHAFGNAATTYVTFDATNATFSTNLVVTGNLTINGTTTTVNSTTLTVDDKNIELGSVTTPTNVTADGGGITLKGATDKTILWDNANANWTSSENWNLATGKAFKINNVDVLNATTLGSSIVSSSLTSVGTITSGTWSGSFGAVSGANLTNLNASNVTSGSLPANVIPSYLYSSGSTEGSYISNGMYWNAGWKHLGTNTYGYVLRNSGASGAQLFVASTAGTLDSVATHYTYTFSGTGTFSTTNVSASGTVTATQFGTACGNTSSTSLTTSTTDANQVIMQLASASYRTVEYLIQATSGTSYHTTKIHVIHNGTDTWVNEYGTMFTGSSLATFAVDISGGQIRLIAATVANAVTVFKVVATTIAA